MSSVHLRRAFGRVEYLFAVAVVVAVLAGVVAAVRGGGDVGAPELTVPPATVTGTDLPPLVGHAGGSEEDEEDGHGEGHGDEPTVDAAVGHAAPVAVGSDIDGSEVTVGGAGRAQIVLFVAHWCQHCQKEVPVVSEWLAAGGLPDGVDLTVVSTAMDPSGPNFPASEWLEREGMAVPVLYDIDEVVQRAYGLRSFPHFVFVDRRGEVALRVEGRLSADALDAVATELAAR